MKPTEAQVKSASDTQLAEWSAEYIKKWKRRFSNFYLTDIWVDEEDKLIYLNESFKKNWNPAQNIGQAIELVDHSGLILELWGIGDAWRCMLRHPPTPSRPLVFIAAETKERAVTIAALLAVVGVNNANSKM